MKKARITLWFALMIAGLALSGYSQGTLAPLYVFTNGDGSITPYQSGQMLEVGQTYDITATPAEGYQFSSWEPVDVYILTQTNYFRGNPILPPDQSIVASVVPTNIYGADLEFTLQDVQMLTGEGQNPNMVEAFGWQANFSPVPEPAEAMIVGNGFVTIALVRHWQRRKRTVK